MEQRIREYGWDKERAITTPKKVRKDRSLWINKALSNGICKGTFYSRVSKCKFSEEEAATIPLMEHTGPKSKFSKEILEKVKANGISIDCFRRRIREGWDIELASTLKPLSKDECVKRMHVARKSKNIYF